MRTKRTMILVTVVALLTLLWIASGVRAHPPADEPTGEEGVTIGSTMSLLMKYQGRLIDPATGNPKPDDTYSMTFSIYDVSTGGAALWSETKGVEVEGGLFNTTLGDVASLSPSIFTGQDLWLGIKVEADAETSPRQQLLPMPYAIYARNADTVDGMEGADLEESAEIDADVGAHAATADAHHPRYTDAEAWAAVLANDGAGSSLDADLLDGLDSSAFGDITTVAAGTGLSGGGTGGAVTLSADTTYLQRRVIGTCASGNAIRVINANGTVTCEADDDTTYTEGTGLSLTDTTFSVNFAGSGIATTVARSDHDHSAADITSGTLSNDRFSAYGDLSAEGYLNDDAGGDLLTRSQADGRYVNEGQADSITSAMIANGEVSPSDLADGAALAEILDDDGAGSGLDADLLDGWDSSDFAFAGHGHWGETWMGADTGLTLLGGTIGLSGSGSESGVQGESSEGHGVHGSSESNNGVFGRSSLGSGVFGESDSGFGVHGYSKDSPGVQGESIESHGVYGGGGSGGGDYGGYFVGWGGVAGFGGASYGGYFNSDTGLALYAAGDATVTGNLTVGPGGGDVEADRVVYSSPHTHYFVVGGEGFVPGSNVDYWNTYGMGGAYINSGSGALVAPVHLPHGAEVTAFEVFFNDTSGSEMSVRLQRLNLPSGSYGTLAQVSSSGISGYDSKTDTSISYDTIDNTAHSYHVYAWSTSWDSGLKIMGALVTYTISEAP